MKRQTIFSGKNKKNIIKLPAELAQGVAKVIKQRYMIHYVRNRLLCPMQTAKVQMAVRTGSTAKFRCSLIKGFPAR